MLTINVDHVDRRMNVLTLLAESGVNQEQMQGCDVNVQVMVKVKRKVMVKVKRKLEFCRMLLPN